jgi:hypothetical protein
MHTQALLNGGFQWRRLDMVRAVQQHCPPAYAGHYCLLLTLSQIDATVPK